MKTMSSPKIIFTYFHGQDSNCTSGAGGCRRQANWRLNTTGRYL